MFTRLETSGGLDIRGGFDLYLFVCLSDSCSVGKDVQVLVFVFRVDFDTRYE